MTAFSLNRQDILITELGYGLVQLGTGNLSDGRPGVSFAANPIQQEPGEKIPEGNYRDPVHVIAFKDLETLDDFIETLKSIRRHHEQSIG